MRLYRGLLGTAFAVVAGLSFAPFPVPLDGSSSRLIKQCARRKSCLSRGRPVGQCSGTRSVNNVVSALNAGVVSAMQSPELRDRLAADGSTVVGSTADELGAHIRAEIAKMSKLVADAKIRLEDAR